MQPANNKIFDSTPAASGKWRNVSNFGAYSIHFFNLEGTVTVEVSNDPSVLTDGPTISAPAAPTTASVQTTPTSPNAGTFLVKTTYITSGGGETTASGASAPQVVASPNTLQVNPPAADAGGFAVAYNVYVSNDSGASYHLQTLGQGSQEVPIPLNQTFILYAFDPTGTAPPASNTSGSPASGLNISGNITTGGTASSEVQIIVNGTSAMWNPSCINFNYVRVVKTGGGSLETIAYLFGQNV